MVFREVELQHHMAGIPCTTWLVFPVPHYEYTPLTDAASVLHRDGADSSTGGYLLYIAPAFSTVLLT